MKDYKIGETFYSIINKEFLTVVAIYTLDDGEGSKFIYVDEGNTYHKSNDMLKKHIYEELKKSIIPCHCCGEISLTNTEIVYRMDC